MDSKDTCCFGPLRTDIQTGAFLVAFLGIIFSFLSAIICFLPSAEWHEHDPAMGFASLFFVVLYGAVIYGQKKGKPIFYVPYFILEALDILYYFFLALTLIVRAISPSEDLIKQFGKENPASTNPEKDLRDHYLVECFTLLLGNTLSVYFFWVIWKSYKKTKEQIGQNGGGHQQFANCV